jgi:hypothetical protein
VIDRMSFHTNLHAPAEEGMPMTNVAAGMPAVASAARGGYGFNAPCFSQAPGFTGNVAHYQGKSAEMN